LIEKISDAIGGIFKPWQIRRVAQAEAEAEKIGEITRIEISELQHRAIRRFITEEAKKQENIESVTKKALEGLNEKARPDQVEDDWISNFFDKCRLVSDDEMQSLWGKVLAGEANSPGTFSKRTVNFIGSLDKSDATLFTSLCSYAWFLGDLVPLIYDPEAEIYTKNGINFMALKHLDALSLISFDTVGGYVRRKLPQVIKIFYYGEPVNIRFKSEENNEFQLGRVLLTNTGQELAPICGSQRAPEFHSYVLKKWLDLGYVTFNHWPKEPFTPASV
jgi:hypothetical protein